MTLRTQSLFALCFAGSLLALENCGGESDEPGGGGKVDAAAGTAGLSGAGGLDSGGSGGTGGSGGSGGAGADDAGTDGSVLLCKEPGAEYKHDVCDRLEFPISLTDSIIPLYFGAVHADCRVAKLTDDHPQLFTFANKLVQFSLKLWGCQSVGVSSFGLIDLISQLTAADAALLIDLYLDQLDIYLKLSVDEHLELKAILECLAKGAVTDPSTTEYLLSSCSDGGDGGSDAAGSDASAEAGDASGDVTDEMMDSASGDASWIDGGGSG